MLTGYSIVDGKPLEASIDSNVGSFYGIDPATGMKLEPAYRYASLEDLDRAANLAEDAFAVYSKLPGRERAAFLRHIAAGIEAIGAEIVERAHSETALPEARLKGELVRTVNQLRLFAQMVEEGSWANARIDPAQPERKPLPRADIRSVLRPLGPVAVFGSSNFPLAFSVAGGDTASALAAGNPVIVKAHSAHPGTSELVGQVGSESVRLRTAGRRVCAPLWSRFGTGRCSRISSRHQSGRIHGFVDSGPVVDESCRVAPRADSMLYGDEQLKSAGGAA